MLIYFKTMSSEREIVSLRIGIPNTDVELTCSVLVEKNSNINFNKQLLEVLVNNAINKFMQRIVTGGVYLLNKKY